MRRLDQGKRSGFTLVEVLITLLIMSGIMVALTEILSAARTARDTIHNVLETQTAGPAILDLVERDLRGILTYDTTLARQLRVKNRVVMGFDADSIDFVSNTDSLVLHQIDERFVRADVNEVGYRLRPSPENDQFLEIYRRESFGVDDDPFEGGAYQFLHDRVKGFDIQVFRKDGPDEEPVDHWNTEEGSEDIGLPARIEITLTLELAPRIVHEQLRVAPVDRRTVIYKRVLRMPEQLRGAEAKIPIPAIPTIPGGSGSAANANGQSGGAAGNSPMEVGGSAAGFGGKGGAKGGKVGGTKLIQSAPPAGGGGNH
ncbi:MAG: prepilin-type N-terminal cleavage/methylation domain-containing protein [Planctomycetes bacterium]|nr:prepilin-type N-terminal cleavage/methylation domain-containing protein [Planctomycetota bacterium]